MSSSTVREGRSREEQFRSSEETAERPTTLKSWRAHGRSFSVNDGGKQQANPNARRPIRAAHFVALCPHKWAVGTTFEWEFELPITTNPGYGHKSASKRKTRKSSKPKAAPAHARKTSKPATLQTVKPKASEKPKRVRLTPEERQERARARAAEKRSKLKEQGLCKDCQQPAILGQTRCPACAENHRVSRRPRHSKGNEQEHLTS